MHQGRCMNETHLHITLETTYLLDELANYTNLEYLNCDRCGLTVLPPLPPLLKILCCSENRLTQLPDLPNGLQVLYCARNQLQYLPPLPSTLQQLHCRKNKLQDLPELPFILGYLTLDGNELPSTWTSGFDVQIAIIRNHQMQYHSHVLK